MGGNRQVCQFFVKGKCNRGTACRWSHDISPDSQLRNVTPEPEDPQNQARRSEYNAWKRLIKRAPTPGDLDTIEKLWFGALEILNGSERDWRQQLPRDLDDDANCGREHIKMVTSMTSRSGRSERFVKLARGFLLVITHPEMLNCLSVDTFVGGLYTFISGTNGRRAILFLQTTCLNVAETHLDGTVGKEDATNTLVAISVAL
jgi:hypothetical protein